MRMIWGCSSFKNISLYEDIEMIKKGLAKGGSLENAIVVKDETILNDEVWEIQKSLLTIRYLTVLEIFLQVDIEW